MLIFKSIAISIIAFLTITQQNIIINKDMIDEFNEQTNGNITVIHDNGNFSIEELKELNSTLSKNLIEKEKELEGFVNAEKIYKTVKEYCEKNKIQQSQIIQISNFQGQEMKITCKEALKNYNESFIHIPKIKDHMQIIKYQLKNLTNTINIKLSNKEIEL